MDLIPEKIYRGKNSNGETFKVNEWTPDSVGNVNTPHGCGVYLTLMLFTCIASPLTLLVTMFSKTNGLNFLNVIGAVLGGYFLYDAYNGWLLSRFLLLMVNESFMIGLMAVTAGCIAGNILKIFCDVVLGETYIGVIFIAIIVYVVSVINYGLSEKDHSFLKHENKYPNTSVYDPSPDDHLRLDGSSIN